MIIERKENELVWPQPIPLFQEHNSITPYPIKAMPKIIANAVTDYQRYGQQPIPLIASSALANISLACQTMANVARDSVLISPISLYFLSVAFSGERKTNIDHVFSQAARQWQTNMREKLSPEIHIAHTLHQAWFAEKEALLSHIRRATLSQENTTKFKAQFVQIMTEEPIVPLLPMLFFEDATQEALAAHMASGWPSASLWSDEGGIALSSHGMQNNTVKFIALLNRLWDGKDFITHRKTSQSFTISNRRLTVSLMMQPLLLEQMLTKKEGVSRQSGFMARSLMAYPESAMGTRHYQERPQFIHSMNSFHDRISACLDESLVLDKNGCHEIPTLSFSPAAKSTWVHFFNETETGLMKWEKWLSIKDFASKAAENTARLAALYHLFQGKEGDIQSETVDQAIQIIQWHLFEARRILSPQPQSEQQYDTTRLLQWMTEKALLQTTPQYLQQYSPIREKIRRNQAIDLLMENNYLQKTKIDRKTVLLINPRVYEA